MFDGRRVQLYSGGSKRSKLHMVKFIALFRQIPVTNKTVQNTTNTTFKNKNSSNLFADQRRYGKPQMQKNQATEGSTEGDTDGATDGDVLGAEDGRAEEVTEGATHGEVLGAADGRVEGPAEGVTDGATDAKVLGAADGRVEGPAEGSKDQLMESPMERPM